MDPDFLTVLLSVLAITTFIALTRSARVVTRYEKGLVLRLGRYRRTVDPGFTFLVPLIEDMIRVDMREQVIRIESMNLITKDDATVKMDVATYYRVVDAVKSRFEVQSLPLAVTELSQTTLRTLIETMSLDETRRELPTLNAKLQSVLEDAMSAWGAEVMRVEVHKALPVDEDRRGQGNVLAGEGVNQYRAPSG